MKIYMDMDGVLCDLVHGLQAIHKFDMDKWPPGEYNIARAFRLETDFWEGCDQLWWEALPKMPDADTIMCFALGLHADSICILTHTPYNSGYTKLHECVAGKVLWLKRHYPMIGHCVVSGFGKGNWASPDCLLIDDCDNNVYLFRRAGGQALLIPRIWNSGHGQSVRKCLENYGG